MKKNGLHISADGDKFWYLNGEFHREDGPAVELASGSKEWYLNGELHREDGPARELASGFKEWWIHGERHRKDGPAIEYADKYKQWYLNGEKYTEEQWKVKIAKLRLKKDYMDDRDIQLWDDLGLFEGRILDYRSFKNMKQS